MKKYLAVTICALSVAAAVTACSVGDKKDPDYKQGNYEESTVMSSSEDTTATTRAASSAAETTRSSSQREKPSSSRNLKDSLILSYNTIVNFTVI